MYPQLNSAGGQSRSTGASRVSKPPIASESISLPAVSSPESSGVAAVRDKLKDMDVEGGSPARPEVETRGSLPARFKPLLREPSPQTFSGHLSRPVEISSDGLSFEVGLDNLGNTCFMNTTLQCLLHVKPLVSYFVGSFIPSHLNRQSPTKGALAEAFNGLVRDMKNCPRGSSISPNQFLKAVGQYAPHLLDFHQQDSQEFFRFLLDGMSEDLCRKTAGGSATQELVESSSSSSSSVSVSASSVQTDSEPKQVSQLKLVKASAAERLREKTKANRSIDVSSAFDAVMSETADGARVDAPKPTRHIDPSAAFEAEMGPATNSSPVVPKPQDAGGRLQAHRVLKNSSAAQTLSTPTKSTTTSPQLLAQAVSPITNASPSMASVAVSPGVPLSAQPHASAVALVAVPSGVAVGGAEASSDANDPEATATKAWICYLKFNDSVITDLFVGQLQSTIECLTCMHRSLCFDPFLDLSVPIPRAQDSRSITASLRRLPQDNAPLMCTLQECLDVFAAEEVLDGDNMVLCEKCKVKRKSKKNLSIFRLPKILVIHLKRFRYNTFSREKLSTNVQYPLQGLNVSTLLSRDRPAGSSMNAVFDLIGVSHHSGSLNGGHYIAHANVGYYSDTPCPSATPVDVPGSGSGSGLNSRWLCFNDSTVSAIPTSSAQGSSAYVLFYALRER